MSKIYISSTFIDLQEYRLKVAETLGQLGHEVRNMEKYVAEDKVPLDKCLEDIGQCNIYVGIFGWRYGYVPKKNNKERLSITEMEFRRAKKNKISCLIFLLNPSVEYLPGRMDSFTGENDQGKRINVLREGLTEEILVSFFTSPDDLARRVSVSVSLSIARAWRGAVGKTEGFADIKRSPLGQSLTPDIIKSITSLIKETEDTGVLDINLHNGDYWWSSRLFLLSALVVDYTLIKCFAFFYNDNFIGLTTPQEMLKSLSFEFPKIAKAYYGTLPEDRNVMEEYQKVTRRVGLFSMALGALEGGEDANKIIVNKRLLDKWLGKSFMTDFIETDKLEKDFEQVKQILSIKFPFVPLLNKKKLVSIIDKNQFANNIATSIVKQ